MHLNANVEYLYLLEGVINAMLSPTVTLIVTGRLFQRVAAAFSKHLLFYLTPYDSFGDSGA